MDIAVHMRRSKALLGREPLLILGLSLCLHIAFIASACGLGLIAAPWFACELFALQLTGLGNKPVRRHVGWFVAGGLFLGLQLLLLTGVIFTMIGLSTSAPLRGAAVLHDAIAWRPMLVFLSTLVVALGVTIPLTFVPHHLLSRRVPPLQALADGLKDVHRIGFFQVYRLVFLTQLLQLVPHLAMALVVTSVWGRQAIPLGALVVFPLQVIFLPVAQGTVTSVFAELRRHESRASSDEKKASPELAHHQRQRQARFVDVVAITLPVILCLLSVASLSRPAPLPQAAIYGGVRVFSSQQDGSTFSPSDSDLQVTLRDGGLHLETRDGGGAGQVGRGVQAMVIEERTEAYVAKLQTDLGPRALHFDRAGVRLDDSLSDRLAGHVPEWFFLLLMVAMVLSTWAVYARQARAVLFGLITYDLLVAALAFFV